jgi:CRISPR/Cas system CSM-associated protein Csm3 (group 7 of RAMP superfamily)
MEVMIHLEFHPVNSIFIGGGSPAPGWGIDKGTMKRLDGCLVIPGSTVKGRLRNECERIAFALKKEICLAPQPAKMCPQYFLNCGKQADYCIICRIFGSPWFPGRLYFSDLVWNRPEEWKENEWKDITKTQVRPGVSISRYLGIKREEKLFFTETSLAGADVIFEGCIEGDLENKQHLALLLSGLRTLFAVGGIKSRGPGWLVSTSEQQLYTKVEVDGNPFTEPEFREVLKQWTTS